MGEPADYYRQFCMSSQLHVNTLADVGTVRSQLLHYFWPATGTVPTRRADAVSQNVAPYPTSGPIPNLLRADLLTIGTGNGTYSYAYAYYPAVVPAGLGTRIAICHHGHEDHGYGVEQVVQAAVAAGMIAVECFMPGLDYGPSTTPHSGSIGNNFIEPILVALNEVLADFPTAHVGMTGVSGGGWATTLCAAADPRIQISYPCSGAYPICLGATGPYIIPRDYEQLNIDSTLYHDDVSGPVVGAIGYLDLFILGSCVGRRQVQCLNAGDLYFGNYGWKTYESIVSRKAGLCGGDFSVKSKAVPISSHSLWPEFRDAFVADMMPAQRGRWLRCYG